LNYLFTLYFEKHPLEEAPVGKNPKHVEWMFGIFSSLLLNISPLNLNALRLMPPTLGAGRCPGGGGGLHVQLCWLGVVDVSLHTWARTQSHTHTHTRTHVWNETSSTPNQHNCTCSPKPPPQYQLAPRVGGMSRKASKSNFFFLLFQTVSPKSELGAPAGEVRVRSLSWESPSTPRSKKHYNLKTHSLLKYLSIDSIYPPCTNPSTRKSRFRGSSKLVN